MGREARADCENPRETPRNNGAHRSVVSLPRYQRNRSFLKRGTEGETSGGPCVSLLARLWGLFAIVERLEINCWLGRVAGADKLLPDMRSGIEWAKRERVAVWQIVIRDLISGVTWPC